MTDLSKTYHKFRDLGFTGADGVPVGYERRVGDEGTILVETFDDGDEASRQSMFRGFTERFRRPMRPGEQNPRAVKVDVRAFNPAAVAAHVRHIERYIETPLHDQRVTSNADGDIPADFEGFDQSASFADADEDQRRPDVNNFVLAA